MRRLLLYMTFTIDGDNLLPDGFTLKAGISTSGTKGSELGPDGQEDWMVKTPVDSDGKLTISLGNR